MSTPPVLNFGHKTSLHEFLLALCRLLRMSMICSADICSACKPKLLHTYGYHSGMCGITGERMWSQNAIRDKVFLLFTSANVASGFENASILPGSQQQPVDIVLPVWSCNKCLALMSPSYVFLKLQHFQAVKERDFSAIRAEKYLQTNHVVILPVCFSKTTHLRQVVESLFLQVSWFPKITFCHAAQMYPSKLSRKFSSSFSRVEAS